MEQYLIFGAGNVGKEALEILGKDKVYCFLDNSIEKQGKCIEGKVVLALNDYKKERRSETIVISVSDKYTNEVIKQLQEEGINNYCLLKKIKSEITKKKIEERIDYINIYNKAIRWIQNNTRNGEGIICNSKLTKPYPEVSGYLIPSLLKWGYRDYAFQYAKWLVSIQHNDGSWYDADNMSPYIFDTAQIIKGLIEIRQYLPEIDDSIIRGCDWILSNMTEEGRLLSPLKDAWGDNKTFSELIHTYCLSPIIDAGKIYGRKDYVEKAEKIANYYTTFYKDEILDFGLLSHFYAYVLEAMIDIGKEELALEAMKKIGDIQKESGAVPGYNSVDWVCSTGLFQFALIWFRLGDYEKGIKAFRYACKLQNENGGWYGSYLSEENPDEVNTYFPDAEISWANKYFLDALYYKQILEFETQSSIFCETISSDDGRYKCIEKILLENNSEGGIRVLDVGCGKGRYLKNLICEFPFNEYYATDLSLKVMSYFEGIKLAGKKQGCITNIPFDDNSFDVTYSCETMEHAIDISNAIKELCRVTKPGGTIAIIDKNINRLGCLEIDEWEQWFSEKELKDEMCRYCSHVYVEKNISFDDQEPNELFYCWIGIKR